MHKRARAHVRAAEKYMHDDTKKAIAHFGRAMHYFGVGGQEPKTGVSGEPQKAEKEQRVFGFMVEFKPKLSVMYLYNNVTFLVLAKDRVDARTRHRRWRPTDTYVQQLTEFFSIQGNERSYCAFDEHESARIAQTLVITEKVEESVVFLIRSKKMGLMAVNLMTPLLDFNEVAERDIYTFLRDPEKTSFKLDELIREDVAERAIESIEFRKEAIVGSSPPVFLITALIVHSDAKAMEETEKRIRSSNTPFTDAITILHENEPQSAHPSIRTGENHIKLFKSDCETPKATPILSCWLHTAFLSGHITFSELDAFEERIQVDLAGGMTELELNAKYIMIVLRKVQREERVIVVCVASRKFASADLLISSSTLK